VGHEAKVRGLRRRLRKHAFRIGQDLGRATNQNLIAQFWNWLNRAKRADLERVARRFGV
jgi:hypothetical protein